jgi:hypothetical protein
MRAVFLVAVVAGFGGTLAAAHFLPWITHTRLPSHTSVVANGGRAEQFLIRLPADRIAATHGQAGGIRVGTMALPVQFAADSLLIEHFKVRDAGGNVIGVAARHWTGGDRGASTSWSLLIPSRGALLLRAPGEPPAALETALRKAGYLPGSAWVGEVRVPLTPEGQAGAVVAGSGEFDALEGSYVENWTLTGMEANRELRGTIELSTITRRVP